MGSPAFPSGPVVTALSYVSASAVILWTLLLLWTFRALEYGFSPWASGYVVLFHLPLVLLLWPRIVWRCNWAPGQRLALFVALVVAGLALAGSSSTTSVSETPFLAELHSSAGPAPMAGTVADEPSRLPAYLLGAGLAGIAVLLLAAMQRGTQRRRAVLAILVSVALLELPFQAEEWLFRRDAEEIGRYVGAVVQESGVLPPHEQLVAEGPRTRSPDVSVGGTPEEYWLFWVRPLSPSASLCYSFSDGRVSNQD